MGRERIIYQDWIVELGYDPSTGPPLTGERAGEYNQDIITAVRRALSGLEAEEASFIGRFYFQGMGYREISRQTGRAVYRLEVLHQSAVKKLKIRLAETLGHRYNLAVQKPADCPLCAHPDSARINQLIRLKKKEETWKPILKILKETYGLTIRTPQRLIGHRKYHMT